MKAKKITLVLTIVIIGSFLTACVPMPSSTVKDNTPVENSSVSEPKIDEDLQGNITEENNSSSALSVNADILLQSKGLSFAEGFTGIAGKIILNNATVNIGEVQDVGIYEYEVLPITEDFREKLFTSVLGDQAKNANYDERNDVWEIKFSDRKGDCFLYKTDYFFAGESVSGQKTFRFDYRSVNLYPFDDNLLSSIGKSSMTLSVDEAVAMCDEILRKTVDGTTYHLDYIFAYGTSGRRPYYKLVFKQLKDNAVVTAFNDISFLVDNDGVQSVTGCLYAVGTLLEKPILSVDEAVNCLKDNIFQISFQDFNESELTVETITMEYVVVNANDGKAYIKPAWRFIVGENKYQQNLYIDRIIAIDAVTGDIIQGRRGNNF